jgi:hypothetical protein
MPRSDLRALVLGRAADANRGDTDPAANQLTAPMSISQDEQPPLGHSEEDAQSATAEPAEPADSAAEAISDNPRLWRALLFAHQPDRHGRCLACVSVRWPCGPRKLAERAEHHHRTH